jgi:hypothetical protein
VPSIVIDRGYVDFARLHAMHRTGAKQAVAGLKAKGVHFTMDVTTARPGVQIAFLTAPENVSIELIQRS